MTDTIDDHDPSTARGDVTWYSSDVDSGPDAGMSIGLGGERLLYVGEVSADLAEQSGAPDGLGWHLVLYPDAVSLAKFHDRDHAQQFFDALAEVLS